jgi:hypothetical protein
VVVDTGLTPSVVVQRFRLSSTICGCGVIPVVWHHLWLWRQVVWHHLWLWRQVVWHNLWLWSDSGCPAPSVDVEWFRLSDTICNCGDRLSGTICGCGVIQVVWHHLWLWSDSGCLAPSVVVETGCLAPSVVVAFSPRMPTAELPLLVTIAPAHGITIGMIRLWSLVILCSPALGIRCWLLRQSLKILDGISTAQMLRTSDKRSGGRSALAVMKRSADYAAVLVIIWRRKPGRIWIIR